MIAHQAKSMDAIFIPFQPLLQKKIKANTIDVRTKDILTTIATKHDVVKCARKMYAWFNQALQRFYFVLDIAVGYAGCYRCFREVKSLLSPWMLWI